MYASVLAVSLLDRPQRGFLPESSRLSLIFTLSRRVPPEYLADLSEHEAPRDEDVRQSQPKEYV